VHARDEWSPELLTHLATTILIHYSASGPSQFSNLFSYFCKLFIANSFVKKFELRFRLAEQGTDVMLCAADTDPAFIQILPDATIISDE